MVRFPPQRLPVPRPPVSSSGGAAERERGRFYGSASLRCAPASLLSSFRRAFLLSLPAEPPHPHDTVTTGGRGGGIEAKDEGEKKDAKRGLEIMKGRAKMKGQTDGREEVNRKQVDKHGEDGGGGGVEGENDCSRLISPHMSPSVRRPGWDGTAALSEMTERAKDTRARQEAECNPMNPGLAYYASERPFFI